MKNITPLIAAALLAMTASALTYAHVEADHAKKASAVKKEQKDCGIAGDAKAVKRTIVVTMSDAMRFTPDVIEVKQGDTVKIVVKNGGKQLHEFLIGTKKELDEHAALMVKFPNMEHDEPYMAHVNAGKSGDIIWTFNRVGDFEFACLIGGHYQAGMIGKIIVAKR